MIVHTELCKLAMHWCYRSWHRTMLLHAAVHDMVRTCVCTLRILLQVITNASHTHLRDVDSVLTMYAAVLRITDDGLKFDRVTLFVIGAGDGVCAACTLRTHLCGVLAASLAAMCEFSSRHLRVHELYDDAHATPSTWSGGTAQLSPTPASTAVAVPARPPKRVVLGAILKRGVEEWTRAPRRAYLMLKVSVLHINVFSTVNL
jgi:hypothetical protein